MRLFVLLSIALLVAACQSSAPALDNNTTADNTTDNTTEVPLEEQPPAQQLSGADVEYFGNVSGYYSAPADSGNYPGVIMIHEWWGLNENIKRTADDLAASGYRVLAVDLYNGVVANDSQQASQLRTQVDQDEAIANMAAAKEFLQSEGADAVASWGYCFGGGQSMQLALAEDMDATVVYYGALVADEEALADVDHPFMLVFGTEDTSTTVESAREFVSVAEEQGIETELHVYEDVGHAFANPSNAQHDAAKAADAWNKTVAFLDEHLK